MAGSAKDTPLRSSDDLLAPFYDSEKPRGRWMVGTEAEKFGVYRDTLAPIPFDGPRGVRQVLSELAARHGWVETAEVDGGEIISLLRGDASITLEPGGQLELSGAPLPSVHATCTEFRGHMAELRDISDEMGIVWLGVGFHPLAHEADLPWVPKLRYAIMREYLPTRGAMATAMMRRTCTVQANFDYDCEQDAVRKLRVALALSPIVTAMFANSPFVEGRVTGGVSHRARVWLDVDPDRSGLLPFVFEDGMSYARYVEWALDVPMFMVKRGARVIRNTGQTFRAFLTDGFEGTTATAGDWETHLNTLFPEVRLKRTLEVRGADAQRTSLICALPALWKGLLYDAGAFAKAERIASHLSPDALERCRLDVAMRGLRAELGGRPMAEWAAELFAIAHDGLHHLSILSRDGNDETVHLARLGELVEHGRCPADLLLEGLDPARPDLAAELVARSRADAEVPHPPTSSGAFRAPAA